jgi:hypothetical protein
MLEDVYDVLRALTAASSRSGGLSEVLHRDISAVLDAADPKIEQKRQAAEAERVKADAEYAEFQAFQAMKARNVSQPQAAPAPAETSSAPPVAG